MIKVYTKSTNSPSGKFRAICHSPEDASAASSKRIRVKEGTSSAETAAAGGGAEREGAPAKTL